MSRRPEPPGGWRNHALHGPMIPAVVIANLLSPVVAADGPTSVGRRAGIPARRVHGILTGRQAWVGFDVADRIITRVLGDPSLWHSTPELAEARGLRGDRRVRRRLRQWLRRLRQLLDGREGLAAA